MNFDAGDFLRFQTAVGHVYAAHLNDSSIIISTCWIFRAFKPNEMNRIFRQNTSRERRSIIWLNTEMWQVNRENEEAVFGIFS